MSVANFEEIARHSDNLAQFIYDHYSVSHFYTNHIVFIFLKCLCLLLDSAIMQERFQSRKNLSFSFHCCYADDAECQARFATNINLEVIGLTQTDFEGHGFKSQDLSHGSSIHLGTRLPFAVWHQINNFFRTQ